MAKKKKNKNQEGPVEAPQTEVFNETAAAQGAAATNQTIPDDVAELIRATLKVLIAQRRVYGLATTITSLTKAVSKVLNKYIDGIPVVVVREFVKKELEAWGYKIITAVVEYGSVKFESEVVLLYRNFDELVDMVKAGRLETLKPVITSEGPDPKFDKMVKA